MSRKPSRKKGRNKHNRQWVKEHGRHLAKRFHGDTDKLTGRKL